MAGGCEGVIPGSGGGAPGKICFLGIFYGSWGPGDFVFELLVVRTFIWWGPRSIGHDSKSLWSGVAGVSVIFVFFSPESGSWLTL